jgi:hypothetical protein
MDDGIEDDYDNYNVAVYSSADTSKKIFEANGSDREISIGHLQSANNIAVVNSRDSMFVDSSAKFFQFGPN